MIWEVKDNHIHLVPIPEIAISQVTNRRQLDDLLTGVNQT